MKEDEIIKQYERYILTRWREAEALTINEIGVTNNNTINIIFDKMTEPFGYWKKRFRYD